MGISLYGFPCEDELSSGNKLHRPFSEAAHPDLRALQILQDSYRLAQLLRGLADVGYPFAVILRGTMAEVEAEDIGPRLDELTNNLRALGGGSQRGYNLSSV